MQVMAIMLFIGLSQLPKWGFIRLLVNEILSLEKELLLLLLLLLMFCNNEESNAGFFYPGYSLDC